MKIASLSPTASDILKHVGALDELVGVSSYCLPFLPSRKRVIGSYTTVSLKALREVAPDVVFLEGVVQDRLRDIVEGAGFRTVLLPFPRSFGVILDDVITVGTLAGRYLEARELSSRLRDELREAGDPSPPSRPRIYVEFWLGRGEEDRVVPGALTYVDEMIYAAGGINALSGANWGFAPVDPGAVRKLDPDAVIFHLDPWLRMDPGVIEGRGWGDLRAVRDGRIYVVWESDSVNLAHHGPSTLIPSISWLASVVRSARH
ncbi:MAG: ABC transporter substrate-binding protein [Conexivisphaera sp.]